MGDEDAAFGRDDFRDAAHSRGKHGNTAGKGLHDDARQVLKVGEQHEEIGFLICLCHLGRSFLSVEDDAIGKIVLLNKCLEFRGFIIVYDMQLKVVALLAQAFDGAKDTAKVLGLITKVEI